MHLPVWKEQLYIFDSQRDYTTNTLGVFEHKLTWLPYITLWFGKSRVSIMKLITTLSQGLLLHLFLSVCALIK